MNLFLELTYQQQKTSNTIYPAPLEAQRPYRRSKPYQTTTIKVQNRDYITDKKGRQEWNYIQVRSYIQFLTKHQNYYDLPVNQRKSQRINILMSQTIKTRTPKQCYAHHQKMMRIHGSVKGIINKFTYLLRKTLVQPQYNSRNVERSANLTEGLLHEFTSISTLCQLQQSQEIKKVPRLQEMEELYHMEQYQQIAFFDQLCQ